jgi:hypothetical protein
MYDNYLNNPTRLMRKILDACVYINETNAKLSMGEAIVQKAKKWTMPLWQIDEERLKGLAEKLHQIFDRGFVWVRSVEDVDKLKANLHEYLHKLKMILTGAGTSVREFALIGPANVGEMEDCLFQMHSIKLSHSVSLKSTNKTWAEEFMDGSKNVVFGLLQQTGHPNAEVKISKKNNQRFIDRIEAWQKYNAQRALGKQILCIF